MWRHENAWGLWEERGANITFLTPFHRGEQPRCKANKMLTKENVNKGWFCGVLGVPGAWQRLRPARHHTRLSIATAATNFTRGEAGEGRPAGTDEWGDFHHPQHPLISTGFPYAGYETCGRRQSRRYRQTGSPTAVRRDHLPIAISRKFRPHGTARVCIPNLHVNFSQGNRCSLFVPLKILLISL